MFSKNHHLGRNIWHDIVPVTAFALALLLTFWMLPKLLPTHWSVDNHAASYLRETTDVPKLRRWTTVWPTVVRFDRPMM